MIREAIDRLLAQGRDENLSKTVFEGESTVTKLVSTGRPDLPREVQCYVKPRETRNHAFETIESFADFLHASNVKAEITNPQPSPPTQVVMVGDSAIVADLDYPSRIPQRARVDLQKSEEFKGLLRLIHPEGHDQKDLWRLLITDLHGCIDAALLLNIGSIKMKADAEESSEIDVTGISGSERRDFVTLTFNSGKGTSVAELGLDYVWTGRIWTCYDEKFSVQLRLELDKEGGLCFFFHATRLNTVLQNARTSLLRHVRAVLADSIEVYQGAF